MQHVNSHHILFSPHVPHVSKWVTAILCMFSDWVAEIFSNIYFVFEMFLENLKTKTFEKTWKYSVLHKKMDILACWGSRNNNALSEYFTYIIVKCLWENVKTQCFAHELDNLGCWGSCKNSRWDIFFYSWNALGNPSKHLEFCKQNGESGRCKNIQKNIIEYLQI